MSDWRLDEEDEPEVPNEMIFGPEPEGDPLTQALDKIRDLILHTDAERLDGGLLRDWEKKVRATNDLAGAERFLRYLAA